MGVEHYAGHLDAPAILAALLNEFGAATDYRTLRDNLPRRLAGLLQCRCVLLYQRVGETLQFASGSFADQPGWSSTLLAVVHINPIELSGETPEAKAWHARDALSAPLANVEHGLACAPLIYRQRAVGVLAAVRGHPETEDTNDASIPRRPIRWLAEDLPLIAVAANVVAMLLENTRLRERDRERIHELSLLNSITSQINCSLRERARVQHIMIQRAREIASVDLCEVILPGLAHDDSSWLSPRLRMLLLQRWQQDVYASPLILERVGEVETGDYMDHLPPRIKTFFALPLIGNREKGGDTLPYLPGDTEKQSGYVLGAIVGAYHRACKLRREEMVLLQILANQASAVLENIALVDDVLEARNEARYLLRQVLDNQRLNKLILERIPSGLVTIDMAGQITTFNHAAERILGYHPLEILGQSVRKILNLRGLAGVLQNGQSQSETLLTRGRDGHEIILDVTLAALHDDPGQQIGVLVTFADVTAMHQLEEEKRRLDRLASLGEMSASVAHEVRNPLASIKTSMQMLRDDLECNAAFQADEGTQNEIAVVLKEVERLDNIVRDLLLFSRPRQLHLVECNLGELCERVLHLLRPQCEEHGVRVHLLSQPTPPAHIDAAQMEQILMNLFLNALQAMPDGGTLSVSCQMIFLKAQERLSSRTSSISSTVGKQNNQQREPREGVSQHGEREQPWLELAVSDTGVGIAPGDLARIFQPFYTTKAHGIGLGLSITRRLIEDHHGYLLVESQLGYGTTISVRLPLNEV